MKNFSIILSSVLTINLFLSYASEYQSENMLSDNCTVINYVIDNENRIQSKEYVPYCNPSDCQKNINFYYYNKNNQIQQTYYKQYNNILKKYELVSGLEYVYNSKDSLDYLRFLQFGRDEMFNTYILDKIKYINDDKIKIITHFDENGPTSKKDSLNYEGGLLISEFSECFRLDRVNLEKTLYQYNNGKMINKSEYDYNEYSGWHKWSEWRDEWDSLGREIRVQHFFHNELIEDRHYKYDSNNMVTQIEFFTYSSDPYRTYKGWYRYDFENKYDAVNRIIEIQKRVKWYKTDSIGRLEQIERFFYNGDAIISSVGEVDSQENFTRPQFSISPNPASDYIEISVPDDLNQRFKSLVQDVRIYNVFGEEVRLSSTDENLTPSPSPNRRGEIRLDVSALPAGVYFVRVEDSVGKFVKIME